MDVPTPRFHMKGNAYLGLQEYINAHVPGGVAQVSAQLPREADRSFFAQQFIASAWYDVMPLADIARTAATLSNVTHAQFMRTFGEAQMVRDANGLYRLLLKVATPDLIVRALPRTAKRYFDFVVSEVTPKGPGHYAIRLSGIPTVVSETYASVTEVFIKAAVKGAGAKDPRVTTSRAQTGPLVFDTPTAEFDREVRWTV